MSGYKVVVAVTVVLRAGLAGQPKVQEWGGVPSWHVGRPPSHNMNIVLCGAFHTSSALCFVYVCTIFVR